MSNDIFNDCSKEQESSNITSGYINVDKKIEPSDITNIDDIGGIETTNGSIGNIIDIILSVFNLANEPLPPLPPPLLLTGANLRPGLSVTDIASRIISRQSDAGLQVGDVFGDGPNVAEKMELIRIEEIVNALQTEAKIEICIPPGLPVTTIGVGFLGIPVISNGTSTTIGSGAGVIR
jgi:hypothetical protein